MLAWVTLLGFAGGAPATVVFGAVFHFSAERLIGSDLAQTTLTGSTMQNEILTESNMTNDEVV